MSSEAGAGASSGKKIPGAGAACVVVDYADTRFSNFAIEYLLENETFRETVFACSYCAQEEFLFIKRVSKISWHCPFNLFYNMQSKLYENISFECFVF